AAVAPAPDALAPSECGGGAGGSPAPGFVAPAVVVRAYRVASDAPADVLVADGAPEHRGTGPALCRFDRLAADHRALDVCEDLVCKTRSRSGARPRRR